MIEIYSTSPKKEEKTKVKSKKKSEAISSGKKTFNSSLETSIRFKIEGDIEELLEDLKEQEKRFIEKQDLHELAKYRALVQRILKIVLDEGYKTVVLKRNRSDKSDFLIVESINERLNLIHKKITSSVSFNILKEIEEIRGLIFDLLF